MTNKGMVIASPLALDYHYVLLLLPLMVVGAGSRPHTPLWFTLALIASYLLIALPLPYTAHRLQYGWLAFLAYPKLYGGLLLWAICLYSQSAGQPVSQPPAANGQPPTANGQPPTANGQPPTAEMLTC